MYKAQILADSISPHGHRLTTFEVTYPRFVHAELLTHRTLSRNSASSRAIPVKKMLDAIKEDPVLPVWWGKNQSGMQAKEEVKGTARTLSEKYWLEARNSAVSYVETLGMFDLHKQISNRITEPWMWITVIVTATEWKNFFALRCHPDAQPEINKIAVMMRDLYKRSVPMELAIGDWHTPMILDTDEDLDGPIFVDAAATFFPARVLVSTGRTARVSYLTHEGNRDPLADTELALRLADAKHWSPWEHAATPFDTDEVTLIKDLEKGIMQNWSTKGLHSTLNLGRADALWFSGNFRGWHQARKFFGTEHGRV